MAEIKSKNSYPSVGTFPMLYCMAELMTKLNQNNNNHQLGKTSQRFFERKKLDHDEGEVQDQPLLPAL